MISRLAGNRVPRWLRPMGLSGSPWQIALVVLAAALLGVVGWIDFSTPRAVSISPIALLVVVAVAWLVDVRGMIAVTAVAVVVEAILGDRGALSWTSAGANIFAAVVIAAVAHVAASKSATLRQARERELSVLFETAKDVNASPDLDQALTRLAASAVRATGDPGSAHAGVWVARDGRLELVAEAGSPPGLLRDRRIEEPDLAGAAARLVESAELGPVGVDYERAGAKRVAVAPIRTGDGTGFGMLTVAHGAQPWEQSDINLLAGIAELAALAIPKAQAEAAERGRLQVLEVLNDAILASAAASSRGEVAELLVEKAAALLGAETVALILRDPSRVGLWVEAATRPIELVAVQPGRGVVGAAAGEEGGVVRGEPPWDSEADAEIAGGAPLLLAVPVRAQSQTLGALAVAGAGFGEEAVAVLTLLGAHLGPALEALRLRGELVRSERTFRELIGNLGCGAMLHDGRGRGVATNWAATELTGMPAEKLLGGDAFGPGWQVTNESGAEVPVAQRPPAYVLNYHRPLRAMVARVAPPGQQPARWLRIDSFEVGTKPGADFIVTTFFEVPEPKLRSDERERPAPRPRGAK